MTRGWSRVRWNPVGMLAAAALALPGCGRDATQPGNPPQVAAIFNQTMEALESLEVSVSAADPDGDALTLDATQLPRFGQFVDRGDGTGTFTFFPEIIDVGSHNVRVTASDGEHAVLGGFVVTVIGIPEDPGGAGYTPSYSCLTGSETGDTLVVFNTGGRDLIWKPIRVPAGSVGLDQEFSFPSDPQIGNGMVWSWNPSGPYPVRDTLVVLTNDPDRSRITIPFERVDPGGANDLTAPDPPILLFPADGAVFTAAPQDTFDIVVEWSEVDECSGIATQTLVLGADANFTQILASGRFTGTSAVVAVEAADSGTVFWKIATTVNGAGLRGGESESRSWTVVRQTP